MVYPQACLFRAGAARVRLSAVECWGAAASACTRNAVIESTRKLPEWEGCAPGRCLGAGPGLGMGGMMPGVP